MGARIINNGGQILASLSNFLVLCRCQAQAQPVLTGLGMAGSLQTQQHHKITTRNLVRVRPSTGVTFLTSDSAQGLQHSQLETETRDMAISQSSVFATASLLQCRECLQLHGSLCRNTGPGVLRHFSCTSDSNMFSFQLQNKEIYCLEIVLYKSHVNPIIAVMLSALLTLSYMEDICYFFCSSV